MGVHVIFHWASVYPSLALKRPPARRSGSAPRPANPLDNIRNTQDVQAVVADGRLYRRADLDQLLADLDASDRNFQTMKE